MLARHALDDLLEQLGVIRSLQWIVHMMEVQFILAGRQLLEQPIQGYGHGRTGFSNLMHQPGGFLHDFGAV